MAATEAGAQAVRSIEGLYRQHVGAVYRYAYAVLGNHADAEDVTQTTFINALRALERGESPQKPENWLLTIAHNIVRQRWRQLQSRPAEVELDEGASRATPEDEADDTPAMADVVRALQRIPTSQRSALVMRELEGRSYQEIAEILDLTTSALETLLFRARKSLAEELENLVTCDRAELAISQQLDGRISRKERKRLQAHMAECPSCTRMAKTHMRYRGALKGLALLPLPASLTLFKGASTASAAGLPAIGLGAAGVGIGATAATGGAIGGGAIGGGAAAAGGGALLGGIGAKVAAVVAAAAVAGGVGYTGVKELGGTDTPDRPAPARVNDRTSGAGAGKSAGARSTPTAATDAKGKTGTKTTAADATSTGAPTASAGAGSSASGRATVANGPSEKGAARGSSADAPGQAVAADHRRSGDVGHTAADDRGRSEEARAAAAAKEKTKAKGKGKASAGTGAATKTKARGNGSTKATGSGSSKAKAKAPAATKPKAAPSTKGAAAASAAGTANAGAGAAKPTTSEKAPPAHEPATAPDPPAAGVDQDSGGGSADTGKADDAGGPKASADDPGPKPLAVDGSSSDIAPADAPSTGGNPKSPKG